MDNFLSLFNFLAATYYADLSITSPVMTQRQQTDHTANTDGELPTRPRPLIMPDTFDGEASHWDYWVSHFESIACVNTWDEQ